MKYGAFPACGKVGMGANTGGSELQGSQMGRGHYENAIGIAVSIIT